MNAVVAYSRLLPRAAVARIMRRRRGQPACELVDFINACTTAEQQLLLMRLQVAPTAPSRLALWRHGAMLERGGEAVPAGLQPTPLLVGEQLLLVAAPRGNFPPAPLPRQLPPHVDVERSGEPQSLDELLSRASEIVGVRLARRGRDKGAWGVAVAALLGVIEHGDAEADWRGEVEIKTISARPVTGGWQVAEDPAIGMAPGNPLEKLRQTLWIVVAPLPDGMATVLSWYFLQMDPQLEQAARRNLHTRPKGPRGRTTRGWYLRKRFFAECGLLATLNGTGENRAS